MTFLMAQHIRTVKYTGLEIADEEEDDELIPDSASPKQ